MSHVTTPAAVLQTLMEAVNAALVWVEMTPDPKDAQRLLARVACGPHRGKLAFLAKGDWRGRQIGEVLPVVVGETKPKVLVVATAFGLQAVPTPAGEVVLHNDEAQGAALRAKDWRMPVDKSRRVFATDLIRFTKATLQRRERAALELAAQQAAAEAKKQELLAYVDGLAEPLKALGVALLAHDWAADPSDVVAFLAADEHLEALAALARQLAADGLADAAREVWGKLAPEDVVFPGDPAAPVLPAAVQVRASLAERLAADPVVQVASAAFAAADVDGGVGDSGGNGDDGDAVVAGAAAPAKFGRSGWL